MTGKKFKRGLQRGSTMVNIITNRVFKIEKVEIASDERKVFILKCQDDTGDVLRWTEPHLSHFHSRI
jgi:hypothetical protein